LRRIFPQVLISLFFCLLLVAYALHPDLRFLVHQVINMLAKADITPVRDYLLGFGVWAPIVSAFLQLVTSVIAPLPSFVVTFANAMVFGFWWGALLTWASWLLSAAVCFGMARQLGRPAVERFATRRALEATDRFVEKAGFRSLLVVRMIPFVNPDVLSYAAGLTNVGWRSFLVSMAIGAVPSTALYSYLGARGVTQVGWLMLPLIGLGLLTLAGSFLVRPRKKSD